MTRFFILGNPRSGTSLFRLVLNANSSIVVPPESGFLHWWKAKYGNWSSCSNTRDNINSFILDLKTSKKIETWGLDFQKLENQIHEERPRDYASLVSMIYISYANQKEKIPSVIGDKNNYFIHHLKDISEVWPDAKFILLVRDGRDVACSYMALTFAKTESRYKPMLPSDIVAIAEEWNKNNKRILDFFRMNLALPFMMVRYEDLVTRPTDTLLAVCSFLGVKYEPGMLDFYISNARHNDEPSETIDWKRKTLEQIDPMNIGKYKSILSNDEVKIFESIAGNLLKEFGYEL